MAKTFTGVVVSDKSNKTIVVSVATRKTHPIYKKQYTVSKKFMAHDEQNDAKVGDTVLLSETRPLSAHKRFALVKVTERAAIRHEEPEATEPKVKSEKPEAKKAEVEEKTVKTKKPEVKS